MTNELPTNLSPKEKLLAERRAIEEKPYLMDIDLARINYINRQLGVPQ